MESKVCTKCKQLKPLTEFHKHKTHKDELKSRCKSCREEDNKKYRQQNFKRIKEYKKKWRQENSEHCKEYQKKHYQENIERYKKYRQQNPNHYREYSKKYYEAIKNNKSFKDKKREYCRKKRQEDIKYRLNSNISVAIWRSLRGNKNGRHWEDLIGCTLKEVITCMEKQWTEGMSWNNYGRNGWVIDHKIPISAFNFSSFEHIDFKRCWSLSNLQPMWASDNLRKHDSLNSSFQPSLRL